MAPDRALTVGDPPRRFSCRLLVIPLCLLLAAGLATRLSVGGGKTDGTKGWSGATEPRAYKVVYDTWEKGLGLLREELVVRRPYWSRMTSYSGKDTVFGTVTNDHGYFILEPSSKRWLEIKDAPWWSTYDYRPLLVFKRLRELGLADVRGFSQNRGTKCLLLRIGNAPGEWLDPPSAKDHADICVDRSGVIVSEKWVVDGEQLRSRRAVSLELPGDVDATEFAVEEREISGRVPLEGRSEDEVRVDDARVAGLMSRMGLRSERKTVLVGKATESRRDPVIYRLMNQSGVIEIVSRDEKSGSGKARSPGSREVSLGAERGRLRVALWGAELVMEGPYTGYVLRGPDPEFILAVGRSFGG